MIGWIGILLIVVLILAFVVRLALGMDQGEPVAKADAGISQTTGRKEIQSDVVYSVESQAGVMAVLADGIGRANTGKVCAQLAVDLVLDRYEPYRILNNPEYFFKSTFAEANRYIQKTLGNRRGGTSLAAVFMDQTHIYYALAGNIRIALLRNGEIIPLSQGQTVDVLAVQAYQDGKISRQEAIWSMDEKRVWNYLGRDGFQEIEFCERPIRIKRGDQILLASKGIFEELSWSEIEDILQEPETLQTLADRIVQAAESKSNPEMENGSILLLRAKTEAANEKD